MYVCIHIYIYILVHIHTHIATYNRWISIYVCIYLYTQTHAYCKKLSFSFLPLLFAPLSGGSKASGKAERGCKAKRGLRLQQGVARICDGIQPTHWHWNWCTDTGIEPKNFATCTERYIHGCWPAVEMKLAHMKVPRCFNGELCVFPRSCFGWRDLLLTLTCQNLNLNIGKLI